MENNQDISLLLSELLHHYDCVIVPELGGFVTEYRSAHIDKALNIIHPPSKDLRFNAQLKKNDGLLANALSQAKEISHEAANAQIKEEVDSYFSALDEGRTVRFEKVGILYLDSHKNMQFRADDSVNYLLDSFRLKKVYASPVTEIAVPTPVIEIESNTLEKEAIQVTEPTILVEEPAPVEAQVNEPAPVAISEPAEEEKPVPVVPISERSSGRRWMAAALIPLLLYLGFVAVRSDVVRDGNIQISDLNPFKKVTDSQIYSPRTDRFEMLIESLPEIAAMELEVSPTKEIIEEETDWDKIKEEFDAKNSEIIIEEPTVIPAKAINTYVAPEAIASMEFHVIGGCFGEIDNAERLVDRLRQKGFSAYIMDFHKGLHRVTYGNYPDRAEALQDLRAIKEGEQADAWLLRKK